MHRKFYNFLKKCGMINSMRKTMEQAADGRAAAIIFISGERLKEFGKCVAAGPMSEKNS